MGRPAIVVKNVSKSFRIPLDNSSGIKQHVVNFYKRKKGYREFAVLSDVSFEVKEGEFLGIVGRNGSGKSTLLKILAGVYTPNKGVVDVNGTLTPFIELGVGFNPELTGRENVFLNGALLGFSKDEMTAMYEEIVDFAELHEFMEERLKNYSSGMQVRLAFSIAIRANTDILLLDEVLAVGDAAFQKKCFNYFMQLKKHKRTVVLVTHDMSAVRQYCDRAIMIESGEIAEQGPVEKVTQAYQRLFSKDTSKKASNDSGRWGTGKMKATRVNTKTDTNDIKITVQYTIHEKLSAPVLGFNIYNSRGVNMLEGNTLRKKVHIKDMVAGNKISITWTFPNTLASDTYKVSVSCCDQSVTEFYDWYNEADEFAISKEGNTAALIDPELEVADLLYS